MKKHQNSSHLTRELEMLRQREAMLRYILTKVPGFVFWKDTNL